MQSSARFFFVTAFLQQRHGDAFFLLPTYGLSYPTGRAIMDKVRAGKGKNSATPSGLDQSKQQGGHAKDQASPTPPPPKGAPATNSGSDEAARRRAFPDLYRFLDELEFGSDLHIMKPQRAPADKPRPKAATAFADDGGVAEQEEQWDHTARPDGSPLAEPATQELNLSPEEMEELTSINDVIRRIQQKDELEDDPLVLLFQKMDQENKLLKIQQEHVENMPEYIGFNEDYQLEEEKIRKEWHEDPRSVTADHVQELYQKLEEKRVELWEKYTTQAGERLARGFEELAEAALEEEEEDGEDTERDGQPRKK